MIPATCDLNSIRSLFTPTERGVVGLVDDILAFARGRQIRLDYFNNLCRIIPVGANGQGPIEIPFRKSVFRAALARVAALCNDFVPNSVTPYGGDGRVAVADEPPFVIPVAFKNTPQEQWLELRSDP